MGTYADLKGVHVVGTTGAMVPSLLHHLIKSFSIKYFIPLKSTEFLEILFENINFFKNMKYNFYNLFNFTVCFFPKMLFFKSSFIFTLIDTI